MGTETLAKFQQLNASNHFQIKKNTLSSEDEFTISGFESAATAPITSMSEFKVYSSVSGIDFDKFSKFKLTAENALQQAQGKSLNLTESDKLYREVGEKLITIFEKDFKWELSLAFNTNIGQFSGRLVATLNKLPANLSEAFAATNSTADVRIGSDLLKQILIAGYENMAIAMPVKNKPESSAKVIEAPKTTYAQALLILS